MGGYFWGLGEASEANGLAHALDGVLGDGACFFGTCLEDVFDVVGVIEELLAFFACVGEEVPELFEELFFVVAVACAAALEVCDEVVVLLVGGDEAVELEDVAVVGGFWVFDWGGVGDDAHDFFSEGFFVFEEADGVVVAFAHFLAVEAWDDGGGLLDACGGEFEGIFAVGEVDFAGDVAGDFEVLFLVFADGDDVAVVDEDVCGHEDWVGEEACAGGEAACGFVFVAVGVFEHGHGGGAGEDPGEFGVFGDVALAEEDAFFWVEAAGEEVDGEVEDVVA